ncbi:MAG: class I SAM-dependent methyltransferase [Chloroflexota bacterium]
MWKLYQLLGLPPIMWAVRNPLKIIEFVKVIEGSGIQQDDIILALGCGKGHWTLALARKCSRVIGVDNSEAQISIARNFVRHSSIKNKVQFLCGRLEDFSFPNETFDRVLSFCVLEHIPNLKEVLLEVFRILKTGGEFHASVDSLESLTDPILLAKHQKDHDVLQYFSQDALYRLFQDIGFEVLEITPVFTSDYAQREFEKRVNSSYKYGLVKRLITCYRLLAEDRNSKSGKGIMLIGRARRS